MGEEKSGGPDSDIDRSDLGSDRQPIVGIGASAGGVEALETFFAKMPAESGLTFVVVQHLSPTYKSQMDSILSNFTQMGISQITQGSGIKPNNIYLSPPHHYVEVKGDRFILVPFEKDRLNLPIDHFFRSLADDRNKKAICIILSGTGTDGTLGLKAVKESGGLALVQEERQARYPGMPKSAIDTGLVDFVLPLENMPEIIEKYVQHPYIYRIGYMETVEPDLKAYMQKIFYLIRGRTGHDFSLYKQTTILRRMERRMALNSIDNIPVYVQFLEKNPREVEELFQEFLIGVTKFFRDAESFQALADRILPDILRGRNPMEPFRVWVPGCSTGEEAYSIAMIIIETSEKAGVHIPIQIFASDIDLRSIRYARTAQYPENIILDVSQDRLFKFFNREDKFYRIKKHVRDCVIFAEHDLTMDPPFSNMDLISCRNVLIYMDQVLQGRILPMFHFSLVSSGILMLGTSESAGEYSDFFAPLDARNRIYVKKNVRSSQQNFHLMKGKIGVEIPPKDRAELATRMMGARLIAEHYGPSSILVDEKYDVMQIYGEINRYVTFPPGEATLNLLQITKERLKHKIGSMLSEAARGNRPAKAESFRIDRNLRVSITVEPFTEPSMMKRVFLVIFEEKKISRAKPEREEGKIDEKDEYITLEKELRTTKEYLQTTIEELQTSNEELKSTNEELQSTNEELETSREELESTNEELVTVNSELTHKVDELSKASSDLDNLLSSTDIATLFLDPGWRIKKFTPNATKIFNLQPYDIGRPISDITSKISTSALLALADEVLTSLVRKTVEIEAEGGIWYAVRVVPYRTSGNVIDGVVVTFTDVTELKRALAETEIDARMMIENVIVTIEKPTILMNGSLEVLFANPSFYALFRARKEETVHRKLYDLGAKQWDIPELRKALENIIPKRSVVRDYTVEHEFPEIGPKKVILNSSRLAGTEYIILSISDATGEGG